MNVQAKCTAVCWDGVGEANGFPALCYPGNVYTIPSDGVLAQMTVTPVAYDENGNTVKYQRDLNGILKPVRIPKPAYIFEFDRNATALADGTLIQKDYSCKVEGCGAMFRTLAQLGNHTNSAHKAEHQEPDDEKIVLERRGKGPKSFKCQTCGNVSANLYHHRKHLETHKKTAETEPVPA